MEKFKSFSDYSTTNKKMSADVIDASFVSNFSTFMLDSVRISDRNNIRAFRSASSITIK